MVSNSFKLFQNFKGEQKTLENEMYYKLALAYAEVAEAEGVEKDHKKVLEYALEYLKKAAEGGHVEACLSLGVLYFEGDGVKQDYQKAAKYLQKAADEGSAEAYGALGGMYYEGKGVEQDYQKALEYYKKAADMGDADACHNLGLMYEKGEGVERDLQEAEEYFKKARKLGYEDACSKPFSFFGHSAFFYR